MKVLQEVRSPCIRDDLQVMTIVIDHPPGAPGYPPHRLPGGPGFGYMISGEMVFEIEGEAPRVLRAGDAFWGPGGDVIHYQDANHRADIPCSFVLTLLCEPGKPMLELVTEQDLEDRKSLRVRPTDIDAATGNSSENARVHQWREATRDFVLTGATAMLATEPPQSLGSISITLTGSALSNHLLLADTGNIALTSVGDHSVARGRYPMSVVPMRLDVLDEPPAIRVMGHGLSGPTQLRVMIELTARNSRTDTTSVMTCAVGSVLLDAQAPLAVLDFCLQRGDRSSRDGTGAQ
jgi:quercetin dioxygenase-like cupin family protein